MSKNIDDILKKNLRPEEEPDNILNQKILDSLETGVEYKTRSRKNYVIYSVCALCACAILCFTTIKLVKVFNNMNYRQSGNGDKSGNGTDIAGETQFETETEYADTEPTTVEAPDALAGWLDFEPFSIYVEGLKKSRYVSKEDYGPYIVMKEGEYMEEGYEIDTNSLIMKDYDSVKDAKNWIDWHLDLSDGKLVEYLDGEVGRSIYLMDERIPMGVTETMEESIKCRNYYRVMWGTKGSDKVIQLDFPYDYTKDRVDEVLSKIRVKKSSANMGNANGIMKKGQTSFPSDFSKINLNWTSADVNIVLHDKDEILVCYELTKDSSMFSDEKLPYYETEGDSLNLYTTSPNVSLKEQVTKAVTLKIPASMFKQYKITTNLTSCKLNLNLPEIAGLTMNLTSCESVAVDVQKINSILQFSTSCSNIVYRLGDCKQIEIDSASDGITFDVGDKFDFNLAVTATGSEFDIFGQKYNDENIDEFLYPGNTDNCTISVNSTSSSFVFK